MYQINKGINAPIVFKGLKAQYIWYLGGGLATILVSFAVLYICGVNMYICLLSILVAGGALFQKVYSMSRKYGEHGLLKKLGKRNVPDLVRNNSRKVFMK